MRLIDNLVRNYPHRAVVDPYLGPDAPRVAVPPLFDLLVGSIAWAIGLGAPTARTVEVVGALIPPILGALTVIVVFLIGTRLFDRRTGFLAAAVLAVAPGQFLTRSVLGFTDHHVAEAFLTALEPGPPGAISVHGSTTYRSQIQSEQFTDSCRPCPASRRSPGRDRPAASHWPSHASFPA